MRVSGGTWLGHCVTSRKVTSSIPNSVTWMFHWHNPSGRTMALRSTQPLTEMSTTNISLRVNGGRWVGLTILPPIICRLSWNLGASTSWNPQGLSRPVMGLLYLLYECFTGRSGRVSSVSTATATERWRIRVRSTVEAIILGVIPPLSPAPS